jgi:hypothetical protein
MNHSRHCEPRAFSREAEVRGGAWQSMNSGAMDCFTSFAMTMGINWGQIPINFHDKNEPGADFPEKVVDFAKATNKLTAKFVQNKTLENVTSY